MQIAHKQAKEANNQQPSCSKDDLDEYFKVNLFELHKRLGPEFPELGAAPLENILEASEEN